MRRVIEAFDEDTIRSELSSLPIKDRSKLSALLEFYENSQSGDPHPVQIDAYGGGILRIRHAKAAYQGRALGYISESRKDYQKLILLLVYKKESDRVPSAVMETARRRMEQHKKRKS